MEKLPSAGENHSQAEENKPGLNQLDEEEGTSPDSFDFIDFNLDFPINSILEGQIIKFVWFIP